MQSQTSLDIERLIEKKVPSVLGPRPHQQTRVKRFCTVVKPMKSDRPLSPTRVLCILKSRQGLKRMQTLRLIDDP